MARTFQRKHVTFYKQGAFMIISALTLLAVVMGMSFLLFNKKIHQPAVSVLIEKSLNDALSSPEDKASVRLVVSPPAGTVRPSWQWRERVRAVVQQTAAKNDYRVYQALYDKPEYPDPDARTIFLFQSPEANRPLPHGLLVLTPKDYIELAVLDQTALEAAIHQWLFGQWAINQGRDADARAAFGQHVLNLASILYAQPRMEQEFPVSMQLPLGEAPLIVECGDLYLSLDSTLVNRLLDQPALERDRAIAKIVEELDPQITPYLKGAG